MTPFQLGALVFSAIVTVYSLVAAAKAIAHDRFLMTVVWALVAGFQVGLLYGAVLSW